MTLINQIDLVMWTKNGANTLPLVLKRINQVIPACKVNKRIIVDDQSTDSTVEIAKSYGWTTISNEGKGISDGANTALKYVESDYFISFEQDLVLSNEWWSKVPKNLLTCNVAVASGIRLPNQPRVVTQIQEYSYERNKRKVNDKYAFLYGKNLDNTIYKTSVIRSLGGFPKLSVSAGIDAFLALKLHQNGYKWLVDYSVRSLHLRENLASELRHKYWYGTCFNTLNVALYKQNVELKEMTIHTLFSPVRGLEIALKKNAPQAVIVYPLMRFSVLKGVFDGIKGQ